MSRKSFPIHVVGQADILPTEVLLVIGYLAILRENRKQALRDLFLGTPMRRDVLLFLCAYTLCALWSYLEIKASFFGKWGLAVFIRDFVLYFFLFFYLSTIQSVALLRKLIYFLLALAFMNTVIYTIIFFQKGHGLLTELFPVFLWNAKALTSGDYYATQTGYLRLYNPGSPLLRVLVVMCFSLFLHMRKNKWLITVFVFAFPIILHFTRMAWISIVVVLPLFYVFMARDPSPAPPFQKARDFHWGRFLTGCLVFFLCLYLLLNVFKLSFVQVVVERFWSVTKGMEESSISGRVYVMTYIWNAIKSSPLHLLMGNGIFFMTADSSYFGLLGALGFLGLGVYAWLFIRHFIRGIRIYYQLEDLFLKALCLGSLLSFLQVMINGVGGNYIGASLWIPMICLLFAIPELCFRFDPGSKRTATDTNV